MNNFFRQICFLKTELLPQEVPLFFSNNPITENIETIFQKIDIIDFKDIYTIPLNFKIPKNNTSTRTLSLLHPLSQIEAMIYIMKFEFLILNHLKRSNFNIRKAIKLNKLTFNGSKSIHEKRSKLEQDYSIKNQTLLLQPKNLIKILKNISHILNTIN